MKYKPVFPATVAWRDFSALCCSHLLPIFTLQVPNASNPVIPHTTIASIKLKAVRTFCRWLVCI